MKRATKRDVRPFRCAITPTPGHRRSSRTSLRAPALMQPASIIVRMIRVGKARELERVAHETETVIARDPHRAGVEDAHAKQLAIVLVRERQELRHGRGGYSVSDDSGGDQAHEQ